MNKFTVPAAIAASLLFATAASAITFNLDTLPTGPQGTQGFYSPNEDYNAFIPGVYFNSTQGVLNQTVGGLTLSLRTADFVYDPANPGASITSIRVENDSSNFGYLGVPSSVQVGIEANGGNTPTIFANFDAAISDFSVNLYRLNSGAGPGSPLSVGSTVYAYSGLNGTGTLLGSMSGSIVGGLNYASTTISLSGLSGAMSFALVGNNGLSNYDMIVANPGGGTPPVPEASSWAMMLAGLGMTGFAARRRNRRVTATA